MISKIENNQFSEEEGVSIVSILVALLVIGIVSLALSNNTIAAMRIVKITEINNAASNLAISKIESIAARDASAIDDSLDEVESSVAYSGLGITFTRTTDVTVNPDNTRTLDVSVASNSQVLSSSVSFSTSLSVWE